ncbi:hypothetical protein WG899_03265 [Paucibacter sp. AS339]|uniref:hypothetical protein n=1 Tax=Paucibacter hankyongi TaxID=3133434 RepID=UPI0030AEB559
MTRAWLFVHLLMVGLWLGCVLTEALFERALLGRGSAAELWLARLHWRVDLCIEIPAFCGVLLSGAVLLQQAPAGPWLWLKLGFAGLAIAANLFCVGLVWRRLKQAEIGDAAGFARTDHLQHRVGAVVLLALLAAMGVGFKIGLQSAT